jgi:hypothetical protein
MIYATKHILIEILVRLPWYAKSRFLILGRKI